MTIELILDNREHHLIQELQKTNSFTFTKEQLDVGDILFRRDDKTIFIIERKTVSDLKASIIDGRHREQKMRLLGSGIPTNRILYIIEGDLDKSLDGKLSGIPVSTLVGSLINTQLRDDIKVYKTSSLRETGEYIRKLLDKLTREETNYFKEGEQSISSSCYAATLQKNKKANLTPEIWFINQLAHIPQVTEKIAAIILQKYSTVSILIQEYQRTPEHLKEKLLADLTVELTTGKKRRIGDKISARIYKFFYGLDEIEI